MKKFFTVILAAMMLAGCSGGENASSTVNADSANTEEEEVDIMANMEVAEFCPDEITETRDGVKYGTLSHETYHSETTGRD